jgi:hypothetical protein
MNREDESLAVLLLPCRLEDFELAGHARDLLAIPRVLALEPSRHRTPRLLREAVSARQARKLRFPGQPRAFLLYHPRQYPLARALLAAYADTELWYVAPDPGVFRTGAEREDEELLGFDQLARAHAVQLLLASAGGDPETENGPLRARLRELDVINHRPFVPALRAARAT